ncbi:MAG: TauD/TfdA family dioxygenase [Alphaproteobacteria bacterium]
MHTAPLHGEFAVRIEGIDLSEPLDAAALDEVRDVWMRHRVAVFPGQDLDDEALARFAERLGPLFVHVQKQLLRPTGRKEIMELSNLPGAHAPVTSELDWHTDQSYTPKPVFGTILHGLIVTEDGGETAFADLAGAWASMPDDLRARVEGVTAVYAAEGPRVRPRIVLTDEQRKEIPPVPHPLVRTHPYLDRKSLYLSPMHIRTIDGMSEEDTAALMAELIAHATQPAHVYTHKWTVGDVVMWDNTSVMHRRLPFPADQKRYLIRAGFHLPEDRAVPY